MSAELRPAAVAGLFYPDTADALKNTVSQLLEAVEEISISGIEPPKAAIAPHAGYIYSGPIAASLYKKIAPFRQSIHRVVLLGPTHRVFVDGIAIPENTAFATPLGPVEIDRIALDQVAALPGVVSSTQAHAQEHALEVQLPFLQSILDHFTLVPVAVGQASPDSVAAVIETLWGGPETLIIVSSDLSHYLPYATARHVDAATCQQILRFDSSIRPEQACGAYPINGMLLAARRHALIGELLDLRNSGDTAGDKGRVVGYGAFMFHNRTQEESPNAH